MFGFLKKKIKEVAKKFSKKIEEEEKEEVKEEIPEEAKEQIEMIQETLEGTKPVEEKVIIEEPKVKGKKPEKKEVKKEEKKPKVEEKPKKEEKKKLGIFGRIKRKISMHKISEKEFSEFFDELELILLENNVALEVIDKIKENLEKELVGKEVKRGEQEKTLFESLKNAIESVLVEFETDKIIDKIEENKSKGEPTKILFVGVNGVGKTTSLAKFAKYLLDKGYSVVISASDTFRAASIEQLQIHANNLGVKLIKHQYGADAAAVAYDAVQYAKAHGIDVVLIDSAGRQHTSSNLMDELKKLKRVTQPDFTIFVADSMTGNDAVDQAKEFQEKVGYDFSILTKADVDEKGGAILSVAYVSGKPIAFLGVGQGYDDLVPFKKEEVVEKLMGNE